MNLFKNKNSIITLIVILILITAFVFVFLDLKKSNSTVISSSDIPLVAVDKNNISEIQFKSDAESYKIINNDGVWRFEDNPNLPIIQSKADGIAYDVSTIFAKEKIEKSAQNVEMYGLDKCVADVNVTLGDGSGYKIHIGNKLSDGNGFYARVNDDKDIYVIDIGKGQNFKIKHSELIDYSIGIRSRDNIVSITLTNKSGEQLVFEKDDTKSGNSAWLMVYPTRWVVSASEMESLIMYPLISLRADEYIVDDEFNYDSFISENKSCVGLKYSDDTTKFFRIASDADDKNAIIYSDGMYYPASAKTKLSFITDCTPKNFINKLTWENLGQDVKFEGKLQSGKIQGDIPNENVLIPVAEQIENFSPKQEDMYIRFYNGEKEFVYKFFNYNKDDYAVTTDGNLYFLVNKKILDRMSER